MRCKKQKPVPELEIAVRSRSREALGASAKAGREREPFAFVDQDTAAMAAPSSCEQEQALEDEELLFGIRKLSKAAEARPVDEGRRLLARAHGLARGHL